MNITGIHKDIISHTDKIRLFFDIPEHGCDTMKCLPHSVLWEYLIMHLKDEIIYDDVYKLIEMDYKETSNNSSGLSTNIFEYLSFYIDVKRLNNPTHVRHVQRGRGYDFTTIVTKSMKEIFDTREGKIFLLAGAEKRETV